MKRIFLGLAIHNHQPLGNFPWVFEDAYRHAYLPMLETLLRHPSISISLHYSGCLVDWLSSEHPEFFKLLRKLYARDQVEIMGGGYYEPILPMIPDADKYGQIGKMSEYIWQEFGRRPRGMWLAERVWEPGLAKILAEAGIGWTLVDDTAFKMIGKEEQELLGYFNTEEQGRYLKIFPISKYLRYSIPWHDIEDVIGYLKINASEVGDRIAVLGDDGEKFGVWPKTYEHCWEKKWMENFFSAIEDNAEWLATVKLGEFTDRYQPAGRIYLPCASYDEMLEWSLPADKSAEYKELKHRLEEEKKPGILNHMFCGYWRNFLVKYPEANRMHKKMLRVSERVHAQQSVDETGCGLDNLWKAQCNCPYWHGVFGGIYLSDIRAGTYSNLIKAENCLDGLPATPDNGFKWQRTDFDGDGKEEILVEGQNFNLYMSPAEGGTLFEWDLRRHAYNLLSTVSRKPEAYHRDLVDKDQTNVSTADGKVLSIHDVVRVKDQDFTGILIYDDLPRSSLVDRFLNRQVTPENYEKNEFQDGGEFAGRPYECLINDKDNILQAHFKRTGFVHTGLKPARLTLQKTLELRPNTETLCITYKFVNEGDIKIDALFTSEWNINLLGGGHNEGAYYRVEGQDIGDARLDSRGEITDAEEIFMGNAYLGIEIGLKLEHPLTLWRFPVECVSNSEGGVEKVYQCSCVVILLPLVIEAGQEASLSYSWRVTK